MLAQPSVIFGFPGEHILSLSYILPHKSLPSRFIYFPSNPEPQSSEITIAGSAEFPAVGGETSACLGQASNLTSLIRVLISAPGWKAWPRYLEIPKCELV